MASYIQTLKRKLVGAIGADVSSATTVTTARADAFTAVDQLESKVLTVQFPNTTNGTTPITRYGLTEQTDGACATLIPFNCELERADFVVFTGAIAASRTDYLTLDLLYTPPAGTASYAVASFSDTTTAATVLVRQQMVRADTAKILAAGGTIGAYITKTGAGQTNGVGCISFVINRRDDT